MTVAYNKFNNTVQNLGSAGFNFSSDTFKVMLTNTAPVATNSLYSDISANEIANGNGYSTGGLTAALVSWLNASGTSKLILAAPVLTASGAVPTFRYAVLYDSTTGKLIAWWDYGSGVTLGNTDTFTAAFDQTAGVLTIA